MSSIAVAEQSTQVLQPDLNMLNVRQHRRAVNMKKKKKKKDFEMGEKMDIMQIFSKAIVTQEGIAKPVYNYDTMERLRHEPYKLSLSKQHGIIAVCSKKKCFADLVNIIGPDFQNDPGAYRNVYLGAQGDIPIITFYRAQRIEEFHELNIPVILYKQVYQFSVQENLILYEDNGHIDEMADFAITRRSCAPP